MTRGSRAGTPSRGAAVAWRWTTRSPRPGGPRRGPPLCRGRRRAARRAGRRGSARPRTPPPTPPPRRRPRANPARAGSVSPSRPRASLGRAADDADADEHGRDARELEPVGVFPGGQCQQDGRRAEAVGDGRDQGELADGKGPVDQARADQDQQVQAHRRRRRDDRRDRGVRCARGRREQADGQ
jgi:hypothetical protein